MKAIAEFAMRGRFQALLLAVGGSGSILFCWISAAVIALITLRKGVGNGAQLLLWALLPSGVLLYAVGDSGPLALIVGTTALAMVLRTTVSLSLSVLTGIAVGALSGLALVAFGGPYLEQMVTLFGDFLANLEQQLSQGGEAVQLPRPTVVQIAGMLGVGTGTMSILCLLLARYWQAALYNPGGFGGEFRLLRYTPGGRHGDGTGSRCAVWAGPGIPHLGSDCFIAAELCRIGTGSCEGPCEGAGYRMADWLLPGLAAFGSGKTNGGVRCYRRQLV